MEANQIISIIEGGETQEVEFKQSFHSAREVSKAICSFANTFGGILLIGISDKKEILGIQSDIDTLQQQISAANQSVLPTPLISVEIHKVKDRTILVVIVQKSSDNSYHTFHGAIYVRVGSTSLDEIDIEKVKEYLTIRKQEKYLESHTLQDFLLSNKLASRNAEFKIKNPVILLFAKNTVQNFPQAEVKLVQFSGKEAVTILSHKLVQESLPHAIGQAIAFVEKHLTKNIEVTGAPKRVEKHEYPLNVVREAVVNAIAHRDYFNKNETQISIFDDRIEITNPGGLPEGMNPSLLGKLSVQRNPGIYQLLKDYDYMEGIGSGYSKIIRLITAAGLVKPDYVLAKEFFRVIFWNKKTNVIIPGLNERQSKMLAYIKEKKQVKSKEYAQVSRITNPTAVADLKKLEKVGYIRKVGSYRGAYYVLNDGK